MTCGCGKPHTEMGGGHISVQDIEDIAKNNSMTVEEVLQHIKTSIEQIEEELSK